MDLPLNLNFSVGNECSQRKPYQSCSSMRNDCQYIRPACASSTIAPVFIAPNHFTSEQPYSFVREDFSSVSYYVGKISACDFRSDPLSPEANSEAQKQLLEGLGPLDLSNKNYVHRPGDFSSCDSPSMLQSNPGSLYVSPDASSFCDTYELKREDSSSTLSALVNIDKLLEEPESDDFMDISNPSDQTVSKGWWHDKHDSIGKLAIKLANVAFWDENDNILKDTECYPSSKSSMVPVYPLTAAEEGKEETTIVKRRNKTARIQSNCLLSSNPLMTRTTPLKEESDVTEKRAMAVSHDNHKKRALVSKPPFNRQQLNHQMKPKNSRKAAADMKPSQGSKSDGGTPSAHPFSFGGRSKPNTSLRKKWSGTPVCVQLPTSKTESVSSSHSSLYQENGYQSAPLPKYKGFSKPKHFGEPSLKPTRRPHYPRKTFSSCSSSSSGGRGMFTECVFCKTNGETAATYRSHVLKDEQGRTVCEVLQRYTCPLCGATGFNAHTLKYCPQNKNPPVVATMTTLKAMRSSTGRKRHGFCSGQVTHLPFDFHHGLLPA